MSKQRVENDADSLSVACLELTGWEVELNS